MTTKTPYDLLSARAQFGVGSRELVLRTGRGLRAAWHDVSTANRLMAEKRLDEHNFNVF